MTIYAVRPEVTDIWTGGRDQRTAPTPAGAFSDLGFWLNPSTLWLDTPSTVVFSQAPQGVTAEALPFLIHEAGWSTRPSTSGWFTCRRKSGQVIRYVHLCVLPWVSRDDQLLGDAVRNRDAAQAGALLAWWERRMGTPYRYTLGLSGHDSLRAMPRRKSIAWAPYKDRGALPGWEPPVNLRALSYVDKDAPMTGLHKWDTRAAYLRAMSTGNYPEGPLQPTADAPQGPGYLRVRLHAFQGPLGSRLVQFLRLRFDRQGTVWMGSNTAQVFVDAGLELDVVESWTAPGGRILRSWAEKVGKLPEQVRKPAYVEAFGMFGTKAGSIQRRDWYHLVIDQANATLLRRIVQVALRNPLCWPVRIETDALVYQVADEYVSDLGEILGEGMRYEGKWAK